MSNELEDNHEPTVNDIKNQVGCMLKAISQLKSSERTEVFGYIQKCVSSLSNNKETDIFQKAKKNSPQAINGCLKDLSTDTDHTDSTECNIASTSIDYLDKSSSIKDDDSEKGDDENEVAYNQNDAFSWSENISDIKCSSCGKNFNSIKRLYNHGVRQHPGISLQCESCNDSFSCVQIYDIHVRLEHSSAELYGSGKGSATRLSKANKQSDNLVCKLCNKEYQNYQHYILHIEGHKRNKCTVCGLNFSSRKNLKQHAMAEHNLEVGSDPFVCVFCGKTLAQKRSLLKHYKLVHSKDHIICLSCGAVFDTEDELKSHKLTHKDTTITCEKCDEKFTRRQQYMKHLQDHDKYQCLTCEISYSNKGKLEQHEQLGHITDGLPLQHQCPMCEAAFHFQSSLFFHKKTHSGKGHYECEQCKQSFATASSYREHISSERHSSQAIKLMPRDENYTYLQDVSAEAIACKVCNKLFVNKRKLIKHESKYHKLKTLLQCEICDFKSYSVSCMSRHQELHTKKKEFICEKCGDFFYTKNALADHLTYVHSEERNFSCEKCGQTFKAASVLNRHMLSHSSERSYTCHCGQSYKFCSNLNRHQMTAHGKVKKSKRVARLVNDEIANLMSNNEKKKKKQTPKVKEKDDATNSIIYTLIDAQTVPLPLDHDQVIVQGNNVLLPNGHDDPQVLQISYGSLNFPNDNNKSQLVYSQSLDITNLHEVDTILQSDEALKNNSNSIMDSTGHETLFARQLTETDSSFLNTEGLIHPPIEPSLVTSLGETLPNTDQLDNTSNQLAATGQQNLMSLNEYCLQYNVNLLNI